MSLKGVLVEGVGKECVIGEGVNHECMIGGGGTLHLLQHEILPSHRSLGLSLLLRW